MATTTYADVQTKTGPVRIGLTPDDGNGYVHAYVVNGPMIGGYNLDRFGSDPLTKAGRLKRSAISNVFTLAD